MSSPTGLAPRRRVVRRHRAGRRSRTVRAVHRIRRGHAPADHTPRHHRGGGRRAPREHGGDDAGAAAGEHPPALLRPGQVPATDVAKASHPFQLAAVDGPAWWSVPQAPTVTVQTRSLPTDQAGTSCDWGGCGRTSAVERHDPDLGWLPVCDFHGARLGRQASPGRGWCPGCGQNRAVSVHGRMYAHNTGGGMVRCPGVDREPLAEQPAPAPAVEPTWWAIPTGKTSHAHHEGPVGGMHKAAVCGAAPAWHGPGWSAEEFGSRKPRCARCCRILDPTNRD
jgi:hypothetical protein